MTLRVCFWYLNPLTVLFEAILPEHPNGGEAMKKGSRPSWIVVAACALILSIAPSAQAFLFKGNVEKAREFVKANMVEKAVELLQQEIEKNPTNAEAHFELGSIYLEQGNLGLAEQRFKGAEGLDAKYTERISQKYMDSGKVLMDKGNTQESIRRFNAAIGHQPSLKPKIAELCYSKANQILEGMTQNTDSSTSETL